VKHGSTTIGNAADNPTDPSALTSQQGARSIAYEFKSASWTIDVQVSPARGAGRNFLFAGHPTVACQPILDIPIIAWDPPTPASDPLPPTPDVNFCEDQKLNLVGANLKSDNLGGMGPNLGDPQEIRFGNVFQTAANQEVDLVITNLTAYAHNRQGDENCLNGEYGNINVLTGTSVSLKFELKVGDAPLQHVPRVAFTIFDVDEGRRNKGQEYVSVCGWDKWTVPANSELEQFEAPDGCVKHGSTTIGNAADNPRDPARLTEQQYARSIAYEFNSATWTIDIQVSPANGAGRNFLFAGHPSIGCPTQQPVDDPVDPGCDTTPCFEMPIPIDVPLPRTPPPTHICEDQRLSLLASRVRSDNLGGAGPRTSDPQEIRYGDVFRTPANQAVDLVITNLTEYKHNRQGEENCLNGQYGNINVLTGTSVSLKFELKVGDAPLQQVPRVAFTIFDVDQGRGLRGHEFVSVCGWNKWTVPDDSELVQFEAPDGCVKHGSTTRGNAADNPSDPAELTQQQAARSIAYEFTGSSWTIDVQVSPSRGAGRNFLFAGHPSIAC